MRWPDRTTVSQRSWDWRPREKVTLARVNSFRRSGTFGLVGVVVTAALVAYVALTMGQGQANPKEALAVIFAIIGVYVVLLFLFQTLDLSRAESADDRAAAVEPAAVENPALLDDSTLWRTMAVRPIDGDAIRARKEIWKTTRQSIRTGMLITGLIFLTVPPIYLLETFAPLFVGVPLIVGIAGWKSVDLLRSGGGLDRAYDLSSRAMAPLGLAVTERPTVTIEPKGVAPFRMGTGIHGTLVLEGERHGRRVMVRMPADGTIRTVSEVHLAAATPPFALRTRDGRLKAEKGAPAEVAQLLKKVPNSTRWNGVRGVADGEAMLLTRKGAKSGDWLLDLWLAERLAERFTTG